jgi:hypothetical protein
MKIFKMLLLLSFIMLNLSCRNDIDVNDPTGNNYIAPFEVYNIISPQEGIRWETGQIYKIKWISSENKGPIDLAVVKKKSYYETIIARGIENTGEYIWQVPYEIISSNHYQVRINHSTNPDDVWYSSEFAIY